VVGLRLFRLTFVIGALRIGGFLLAIIVYWNGLNELRSAWPW